MKAIEHLPDDKKLELVNISAKGRKYLLLIGVPLVALMILAPNWFPATLGVYLVGASIYNYLWFKRSQFPSEFMSRQLVSTLFLVVCGAGLVFASVAVVDAAH